jgi:cysteine desulfurase / selenocysteine lyase
MGPSELKAAYDVDAVRAHYPSLEKELDGRKLVYLDSACTALKPASVAARLAEFYAEWGGCGGKRSTHRLSQKVEEDFQKARRAAAAFLKAESPNEIVFTSGTTEAVNLVARAFPYDAARRKVVITDLEHNAVALPFIQLASEGVIELSICPSVDGVLDMTRMADLIDEGTALVALTHASNVMGGITPVAEVAKLGKRKGARILVDDAQYLGTHREDVSTLGADFVAFSAHKLGGPFGTGVLWGHETELNRLNHYKLGGGTVKNVKWDGKSGLPEPVYLDAPMRFEAGVQDFGGALGLHEALAVRESLPAAALREHVSGLVLRAYEKLSAIPEIRVLGKREQLAKGSLLTFVPAHPDFSPPDFNLFLNHELDGRFIAVRVGEHCAHLQHRRLGVDATVRASFGPYSTAEEADLFVDAVKTFAKEACGG